jgi:hypothetical protein
MATGSLHPATNTAQQDHSRNSGWWETYVIRYFVGTIVGSAILLFLNSSSASGLEGKLLPGIKNLASLDAGLLTVVAAMGFTYCYISSGPILVIHASRAVFFDGNAKSVSRWLLATSVLNIMACALLIWRGYEKSPVISVGLIIWVGLIQVVPFIFAIKNRANVTHEYYEKLSLARAETGVERTEYKESYRHLREHGNAFLILLFEGLLGVVLLGASNSAYALICLLFWIVPASLVWCLGTWLEVRYARI